MKQRTRKEIQEEIDITLDSMPARFETTAAVHLIIQTEVLLDIRDLLQSIHDNPSK